MCCSYIDFSASESGDSGDYWCPVCEEHHKPIMLSDYLEQEKNENGK